MVRRLPRHLIWHPGLNCIGTRIGTRIGMRQLETIPSA
ncbi:hypothetical protein RISK_005098 [Rhodopirellula islandica]|uniref:Uncharacterized protein n=1 Tax=Rhodopirellula islandica TaxID=595434 RepID=A0A0J1B7U4_RHOIS|nr:hypothetical protein RISK_005098 [Rhodopirellula islandica]